MAVTEMKKHETFLLARAVFSHSAFRFSDWLHPLVIDPQSGRSGVQGEIGHESVVCRFAGRATNFGTGGRDSRCDCYGNAMGSPSEKVVVM